MSRLFLFCQLSRCFLLDLGDPFGRFVLRGRSNLLSLLNLFDLSVLSVRFGRLVQLDLRVQFVLLGRLRRFAQFDRFDR